MKRTCPIITVLLIMLATSGVVPADDDPALHQKAGVLIAKIIAAYGGKDVVEGLRSFYASGDIEAFMRRDRGTYELYFERPRKLRVVTEYESSSETRILNGKSGFKGIAGSRTKADGQSLLAMVYQYKHLDLPFGLLKSDYIITMKAGEELNGKPVEVMQLTDSEGPPMDVYVDARSFLIVKVTGYFTADGRSTSLSSEFSDFRKVGGTVFPFRITNYAGGYRIAETSMKTYDINPPMPDSLFIP